MPRRIAVAESGINPLFAHAPFRFFECGWQASDLYAEPPLGKSQIYASASSPSVITGRTNRQAHDTEPGLQPRADDGGIRFAPDLAVMSALPKVAGKTILLVDDDCSVRQSIKQLLDIDRHAVTEAANGRQALQLFTGSNYDLVITDYLMPEMRGDELAQSLKTLMPSQPILMITAYVEKLENAGGPADAVLAKPFGLDELRQAVASEFTLEISPPDAREHFDSGTLVLWVQEEVQSLDSCVDASRHSSVAAMLQLLTFAYACNVLGSDEVKAACMTSPAFRYLCGGSPPFASEIAAFRRRHRPQLELALARTLAKVARCGGDETSGSTCARFLGVAAQRLDIARHLDA